MAKTVTTMSEQEALAAYAELRAAADKFQSAVHVFGTKFAANSVGIVEMAEAVDEWLWDISADIAETFDSDEE